MKILLNKISSKTSRNVNNALTTQLKGSKKLLPQSQLFAQINEMEVYNNERNNCNLIRLNCVINPICSNILFNSITEIVKNEGEPNAVKLLNYGLVDGYINRKDFDDKIYCKNSDVFMYGESKEGIRDTQLSSHKCGFNYNCGIDIFNNHILRNNTFKTVCFNEVKNPEFNTIIDWMRDENGINIKTSTYDDTNIQNLGSTDKMLANGSIVAQHLYTTEDVDTFENTIDNKLIEKNGWFGFTNIGKFSVVDNNNETMDIFRVINYRRSCDFIQMYPSSDLWSFTPKYNSYLHRLEKNWNYCLTYPSSSTTQNITFIREKTNSLKAMYVDDRVKLKSGISAIKIYSICKHGLKKGDFINLYKNNEILFKVCEVREVEDEYIFYIFSDGVKLSNLWHELTKADTDTIGIDDFFTEIDVPLTSIFIRYSGKTYSGDTIVLPLSNDIIQKTDIQIVNDETTKWETINFHGKSYKVKIQSNTRALNLDPMASGETIVTQDKILFDFNYEISDGPNNTVQYKYTISKPRVKMKMQYIISSDRDKVYCGHGDDRMTYYLIDNKYVNIDDEAQDFSYKKVVDGEEVEYYVRIFSRLPNWKGCDIKIDQHQLYGTNKNLIARYQTLNNDFENHISQLAFAKNIYGDDISQVVYTDDIDISYLKDNLGRPLTSIYFTILKNNKGYKEWYGKNGVNIEIRKKPYDNDEDYHIEYSHCFGMLNCAFRLSKESLPSNVHNNSMQINNIDSSFQYQGLDVEDLQHSNLIYEDIVGDYDIVDNEGEEQDDEKTLNRPYRSKFKQILNDEVQYGYYKDNLGNEYLGDTHFYGDLCAYSRKRVVEEPIQQVEMRFNTAQRELSSLDKSYQYFKKLCYDEILSDDKDKIGFAHEEIVINAGNQHKEGYCYYPHYEIPIKTFSKQLTINKSLAMVVSKINAVANEKERQMRFEFKTLNPHQLQVNDTVYLKYDKTDVSTNRIYKTIYYICYVTDIINKNIFECIVCDEDNKRINALNTIEILSYKMFKKDSITPDYATFTKDGSCNFIWREVLSNGFDNESNIETYPFFNGALYVNKQINLFVRRQDPNEYTTLQTGKFPMDIVPNSLKIVEQDNYYTESDISC